MSNHKKPESKTRHGNSGGSFFAQKPVRRASLVSPWGVGSMLDFPGDESLMTAGLDAWPKALDECPTDWKVVEERLQQRLGVDHFRLPPDFRTPGAGVTLTLQRVPFVRFPQWHYCARCGDLQELTVFGEKKRCEAPKWATGLSCDHYAQNRRPFLMPSQFVAICSAEAHIQDFPFMEWAHKNKVPGPNCRLRLRTNRSTVSLGQFTVSCLCGVSANLSPALRAGALDEIVSCCGQRPWLGEMISQGPKEERAKGCGGSLRVVQRGTSNVYFPHVASSIYLPLWGENVRRPVVEALEDSDTWDALTDGLVDGQIDLERCKNYCRFNKWRGLDAQELWEAAQRRFDGNADSGAATVATGDRYSEEEKYRYDEYQAMRTGRTVEPELEMNRDDGDNYGEPVNGYFRTITLVCKLRETRALYGFSRYLPEDGRQPEAQMAELCLDPSINWLPAIVTRGEGIFFELSDDALTAWLHNADALKRASSLISTMNRARIRREQPTRSLSPKFVLLHTLAHLVINQLAFDCGYGSSSLRERIYCDGVFADKPMNGFLIYTASGDSEGTMGGLVRQGECGRLEATLARALRKACWCSYDPVCAESLGQGPDNCNRAACHGCAIAPETSCEEANRLLDRATVVGTPQDLSVGYFGAFIEKYISQI